MRISLRRGFTLIELLVVISIIAMLFALLLPALALARDTAKVALCGSQLRQIAMRAVGQYAGDYKGFIVPAIGKGGSTTRPRLNYYAGGLSSNFYNCVDGYGISFWELLDLSGPIDLAIEEAPVKNAVAYCPAEVPWEMGPAYDGTRYRETTYSLNAFLSFYNWYGGRFYNEFIITREDVVLQPSNKVLIVETHHKGVHGVRDSISQAYPDSNYMMSPMYPTMYQVAGNTEPFVSKPRHAFGFNSSFIDGHVKFIKHSKVNDGIGWMVDPGGITTSEWYNPGFFSAEVKALWWPTEFWYPL